VKIGAIGYGARISHVISEIRKIDKNCEIAAICDPRRDEIKEKLGGFVRYYDDADLMLDSEKLDGALIGTTCNLHTEYAVKVLERKIPLYLEKPVAITEGQLLALEKAAGDDFDERVVVSLPLKVSPYVRRAKEIIDSGKIGKISSVQSVNNVPYGWCYFKGWCRDGGMTGGLFLQKATHDFDYLTYLIGQKPVKICAMESRNIFKGDMPRGLVCGKCEKAGVCRESPENFFKTNGAEVSDVCVFTPSSNEGSHDSASAIVMYENGAHLAYSQNFVARRGAASRLARVIGYEGTLEFDFYGDKIKVVMHHEPWEETYALDEKGGSHGGGDGELAADFIKVMKKQGGSRTPLSDGILSARMCLAAKESAESDKFTDI
jgi:predicted dehydrogenase